MLDINGMINSIYPSLREVYAQEIQDNKDELQALLGKAQERVKVIQAQQDNRIRFNVDKGNPCSRLLGNILQSDEDTTLYIINHAHSTYRRVAVENSKGTASTESVEVLSNTLMLLDIVDCSRDTLIDTDQLCRVLDAPSKVRMLEQLQAFETYLGIIAICTNINDNRNLVDDIMVIEHEYHEVEEQYAWGNAADRANVEQAFNLCMQDIERVAQRAVIVSERVGQLVKDSRVLIEDNMSIREVIKMLLYLN